MLGKMLGISFTFKKELELESRFSFYILERNCFKLTEIWMFFKLAGVPSINANK
jgi:hypothetical protein